MDRLLANPRPPSSSALPGIPMGPTGELKDIGMIRECAWVQSIQVGTPVARKSLRSRDTAGGHIAKLILTHFFLALHSWS